VVLHQRQLGRHAGARRRGDQRLIATVLVGPCCERILDFLVRGEHGRLVGRERLVRERTLRADILAQRARVKNRQRERESAAIGAETVEHVARVQRRQRDRAGKRQARIERRLRDPDLRGLGSKATLGRTHVGSPPQYVGWYAGRDLQR